MNPLSIVLFTLQSTVSAIRIVEGFIADAKVKNILEEVASAIAAAVAALSGHANASPRSAIFKQPSDQGVACDDSSSESCEGKSSQGHHEKKGQPSTNFDR